MITDEELAAMQARADAATPGPWGNDGDVSRFEVYSQATYEPIAGREGVTSIIQHEWDGRFIAASRTDVPRLIEEVRRLRAERDAIGLKLGACTESRRACIEIIEDQKNRITGMVQLAAPAAIGWNVIEYAPPGPVGLTSSQREDVRRELKALQALRATDPESRARMLRPDQEPK